MGTEPIDETSLHASRRYVYDAILSAIMECLPGHTADQCHDEIAKAWNHLYTGRSNWAGRWKTYIKQRGRTTARRSPIATSKTC